MSIVRNGLVGLGIGIAGGILAGILLSSKNRSDSELDPAWVGGSAGGSWPRGEGSGLLPDEQITVKLKSDLQRRGNLGAHVDVTTIDGVVYLRGREPDPIKADDIVAAAYAVPGVRDVVDEVHREA
jgi:hypothetical protein